MNPDPVLTGSGSGLFSDVGSGPNRSGSATLLLCIPGGGEVVAQFLFVCEKIGIQKGECALSPG